jgi:hypothetical protein
MAPAKAILARVVGALCCAQVAMKNTFMVVKNLQRTIAWKLAPLFLPYDR